MHISLDETTPPAFASHYTAVPPFTCSWLPFLSHYVNDHAFAVAFKRESFRSSTPSVWRAYAVMTAGSLGEFLPAYSGCRVSTQQNALNR